MEKGFITPRILKGFRDFLPDTAFARQCLIRKLEKVFLSFGLSPIDTPALEYADILLGKGSEETDKQLYRFLDNGERDVALRFDLTVPLARFAAMHLNELDLPFRRYHIAPVWRAEKPQKGRYREFMQCDFDIIGTASAYADAEIIAIIHSSLSALSVKHRIRINNRSILNGFLESLGAKEHATHILRAIDKLDKLGNNVVAEELSTNAGLDTSSIDKIFNFLSISRGQCDNEEIISKLQSFLADSELALQAVNELDNLSGLLSAFSLGDEDYSFDLSIARGLDYYTGIVFETVCCDLPQIGSICSGGRYDNLASLYTKAKLPGVGASIGLDRLLAALEELHELSQYKPSPEVLVTLMDDDCTHHSIKISHILREAGISTELFLEPNKKLASQLKYADKKHFALVVIAGAREAEQHCCSIKDMRVGEQRDGVLLSELVEVTKQMLERVTA